MSNPHSLAGADAEDDDAGVVLHDETFEGAEITYASSFPSPSSDVEETPSQAPPPFSRPVQETAELQDGVADTVTGLLYKDTDTIESSQVRNEPLFSASEVSPSPGTDSRNGGEAVAPSPPLAEDDLEPPEEPPAESPMDNSDLLEINEKQMPAPGEDVEPVAEAIIHTESETAQLPHPGPVVESPGIDRAPTSQIQEERPFISSPSPDSGDESRTKPLHFSSLDYAIAPPEEGRQSSAFAQIAGTDYSSDAHPPSQGEGSADGDAASGSPESPPVPFSLPEEMKQGVGGSGEVILTGQEAADVSLEEKESSLLGDPAPAVGGMPPERAIPKAVQWHPSAVAAPHQSQDTAPGIGINDGLFHRPGQGQILDLSAPEEDPEIPRHVPPAGAVKPEPHITPISTTSASKAILSALRDSITKKPGVGEEVSPSAEKFDISSLIERIKSIFEQPEEVIPTLEFQAGKLTEPTLDGPLKHVNITYPVNPPYQYVHIEYNKEERALFYHVVEPPLTEEEDHTLLVIKKAFEKMISTNTDLITGGMREEYLKERFTSIVTILGLKLTEVQKEKIYFYLAKDYLGYGKLDTLMKDKYIEDISCNGAMVNLYVQHRTYGPIRTNVTFEDLELNNFVLKIAQVSGRHISLLQPIRDVTLPDGSRGNLTLGSEVTRKGSTFTIRKFRANPISAVELMDYGTIDAQQLAYMWLLMEYKRSILVSGGTASGKTTFLNCISAFIPMDYKIVSIEDTSEINLFHPNWLQSVTRTGFGGGDVSGVSPSGISGGGKSPGEIGLYDLLVAALRQRPEYIIVGEVRGPEAFTLFQAIAVGHAAMGTIHAGSMDELLSRIESNPMNVPRSLFSNIDAVVFPMQLKAGERNIRRITNVVEILELDREKGDLVTNTVFKWNAEKDEFKFSGRSYLFDVIKQTFGVSLNLIRKEWDDRTQVLDWLQRNSVKDYKIVQEFIMAYYKDKEEVMGIVNDPDGDWNLSHNRK